MATTELTSEQVIAEVKASDCQKVKLAITDVDGVLRGKYINKNKFLSAAESGFGFCNVVFGWDCADVCYDNVDYTGWHSGYPDAQARIDLSTYRKVPWDDGVPFFLGDFVDADGSPLGVCPRQVLKRVIEKAHGMGFAPVAAIEYEFFNFLESPASLYEKKFQNLTPLTPGMFGYSLLRASRNQPYFAALMDELLAFDVPLEGIHTETGPGVFEAAIMYSDPLEAADRAVLFKAASKEIAARFGIIPTFMAKIDTTLPGCGGHIHQSLWDHNCEINVFFDSEDPRKMSDTFRHYLAGQMKLAPELTPCFAPTVNSYKRLVEGMWAPTKVTWGADNRTASFRVLPGSEKSTRLETRVPGADANPYLALAAAIGSGLYGIEHGLEPVSDAVTGNAYEVEDAVRLPATLLDASKSMAESEAASNLFGDEFVNHFAKSRIWECRQYQQAVTSWELERYFEII
ncbi:MAG: glutamine synthetase family protein [Myxococcota bacterium]|nr:glutamine synthetase family protein [Myxococcota bacterium]